MKPYRLTLQKKKKSPYRSRVRLVEKEERGKRKYEKKNMLWLRKEEESENGGNYEFFFLFYHLGEMIFFPIQGENGKESV